MCPKGILFSVVSKQLLTMHWKINSFLSKQEKPGLLLYKNLTFTSVLDSTENKQLKPKQPAAQEQVAEAEKQSFHSHSRVYQKGGYVQKAASLPQLAHRAHCSEQGAEGVARAVNVSSKLPLFGSAETNIKFNLKLKSNPSIAR